MDYLEAFILIILAALCIALVVCAYGLLRLPWVERQRHNLIDDIFEYNTRMIHEGKYCEARMDFDRVVFSLDSMLWSLSWNVRDFVRPDAWEKLYGTTEPA